jgi:glycerol-3-phosphate dehydrogenase (NAD(P)+)
MAALTGDDRPEVRLGVALADGATLEQAMLRAEARVEAVTLVPRVVAFARERRMDVPVFHAMAAVMAGTMQRDEVMKALMTRQGV